jgi:transposase-like protein
MSTLSPLDPTVAYLRFPLRAEHRAGLCDGSRCPHCSGTRIQKWGRFTGRQRFRCRDCGRTFSLFTGTPLRYLKRPERWRAFLWCMEGRLTVRRTGAVVGIDKNTALRWRHRVLDSWRSEPRRRLRGSVAVGEFRMPRNEKGRRRPGYRPRRHGHAPGRRSPDLEWIGLIAAAETDGDGARERWIRCANVRILDRSDHELLLGPRLGAVREIVGGRGPLSPVAWLAGSVGVPYRVDQRGDRPESIWQLRRALRRWLSPLRGVATRRLNNYLEWFARDGSDGTLGRATPVRPTVPAYRARGSPGR